MKGHISPLPASLTQHGRNSLLPHPPTPLRPLPLPKVTAEAQHERRDPAMTGLPQGQLPGRCFKARAQLPGPGSCDPNLWLCLMGFAALCRVLWLFIWVKDSLLPFMSERLPQRLFTVRSSESLAHGRAGSGASPGGEQTDPPSRLPQGHLCPGGRPCAPAALEDFLGPGLIRFFL